MLGHEAAAIYGQCAALAEQELVRTRAALEKLGEELAALDAERTAAALELAAVYLPELSDGALRTASYYTGLRVFDQRDPLQAMAREAVRLRQEIERLEGDERHRDREALVGPMGTLTRALQEARDYLSPWEEECLRFESLPHFLDLVAVGYDTPAFSERWWEPSYWRHWAQGDAVCEALGMADFGDDVLPAWRAASGPRDTWREQVRAAEEKVNAVHELVRRRDAAADRLQHLPEIYLDESRAVLARHLMGGDAALFATWAEGRDGTTGPMEESIRRAVVLGLKKLSGLAAKKEALEEAQRSWGRPALEQLEAAQAVFKAKQLKYSYGKKAYKTVTGVPLGYDAKIARLAGRRDKVLNTVGRVRRFEDYGQFRLDNDPALWWLLFSDNRPPPLWMPELRGWYDRHPDVIVVRDDDWEADRRHQAAHHAGGADFGPAGDLS